MHCIGFGSDVAIFAPNSEGPVNATADHNQSAEYWRAALHKALVLASQMLADAAKNAQKTGAPRAVCVWSAATRDVLTGVEPSSVLTLEFRRLVQLAAPYSIA